MTQRGKPHQEARENVHCTPRKTSWLSQQVGKFAFATRHVSPFLISRWTRRKKALRNGAELFTTTTRDDVQLECLYLEPATTTADKLPVVFSHGWVEVKENYLPRARQLCEQGHPVILYDQRGHGGSQGKQVTYGLLEKHDLSDVISHCQQRGWMDDHCLTLGHSMGAAVALMNAAQDDRVAGVIAFAPFLDLRTALATYHASHVPFLPFDWAMQGVNHIARKEGYDMAACSVAKAIPHIHVPVLLVTAGRDRMLPNKQHGDRLLQLLQHHDVQHHRVEKAQHFNLCLKSWPGLDEKVVAFAADVSKRTRNSLTSEYSESTTSNARSECCPVASSCE